MRSRNEMLRDAFIELKRLQKDWKPILDNYRSQLGDKSFKRLMRVKSFRVSDLSDELKKMIKKGEVGPEIASVFLPLRSEILQRYSVSDPRERYLSLMSMYLRIFREMRMEVSDYSTRVTQKDNYGDLSTSLARSRISAVWSGYGSCPINIDAASSSTPAHRLSGSDRNTRFVVSKKLFRNVQLFPECPIDSAAPIGFDNIEESDGIRSAYAWVFRQHLRRGIDREYKASVTGTWIAYNPVMQTSALSDKSRDAAIKLLKSRSLRAINNKIMGV